ncbi:MAG: flippase-like domain-containing protein [Saprospiraceae bacterium]|nr:flippase-like domain-containing protein [Saprospiraceae bacterium]
MHISFRKYIIPLLKLILAVALCLVLYNRLFGNENSAELYSFLKKRYRDLNFEYLWLCLVLLPANWILEAFRWQFLTSVFEKISLRQSLNSVLSGVAVGVTTPARIGEYAGRLLHLNPQNSILYIGATFLGSIAQNLVIVTFGLPLSYFFLKNYFRVTSQWSIAFSVLICTGIVIAYFIYYNIQKIVFLFKYIPFLKHKMEWRNKLETVKAYNPLILTKVWFLSFIRYLVFFGQYYCIILFLDVLLPVDKVIGSIGTIYMIQSGIPLPPILGLLARSELAISVWSSVGIETVIALAATVLLWLINLAIPAIIGLTIILKLNFKNFDKK